MSANRRSLVGPGGTSSAGCAGAFAGAAVSHTARSEEHTSELQSRFDLVCGLLLEQKQRGGALVCTLKRRCMRAGSRRVDAVSFVPQLIARSERCRLLKDYERRPETLADRRRGGIR